jgi:hypothetical protein
MSLYETMVEKNITFEGHFLHPRYPNKNHIYADSRTISQVNGNVPITVLMNVQTLNLVPVIQAPVL